MSLDKGHFNCRDYNVPLRIEDDDGEAQVLPQRHESYDDLERRSRSPASSQTFAFLRLPLELRQQVYSYLIPRTQELKQSTFANCNARSSSALHPQGTGAVVPTLGEVVRRRQDFLTSPIIWHRGCVSLLGVCKQVHDEVAAMIYGDSTFLLFVTFSGIIFQFRWKISNGLPPSRSLSFLDMMPKRYLALIRKVVVHIDHVDSYTAMNKFNVSGKGLVHGLRNQVQRLVHALQPDTGIQLTDGLSVFSSSYPALSKVVIRISSSNAVLDTIKARSPGSGCMPGQDNHDDVKKVLEPFEDLAGVRDASVVGTITQKLAQELEAKMRSTQPRRLCCRQAETRRADQTFVSLCVYGNDIA